MQLKKYKLINGENMFLNFTNHPSKNWSQLQVNRAMEYGDIVDLPFPNIPISMSEQEIIKMSNIYLEKILSYKPAAVLCQGEMVFTHIMVNKLKKYRIKVLAAISDRITEEKNIGDKVIKTSEFNFVGFREYIGENHGD